MYTGTIPPQKCSFCSNLNNSLSSYDIRIKRDGEIIKDGRYFACEECASKIETLRDGIKDPIARPHRFFERVVCQQCGQPIAENWYIRHVRSGCKIGM